MRYLNLLFLVFLPSLLLCQVKLDTVNVYDGFNITYLTRKDTVLLSNRKWNDLVEVMRSFKINNDSYIKMQKKNSDLALVYESQIKEQGNIIESYKQMSDMYKSGYDYSLKRMTDLTNAIDKEKKNVDKQVKRNLFNGIVIGTLSGFVTGIITTVILLK